MSKSSNQAQPTQENGDSYQIGAWDPSAYDLKGVIQPLDEDEYIEDDTGLADQDDDDEDDEDEGELLQQMPTTSSNVGTPQQQQMFIQQQGSMAQSGSSQRPKTNMPYDCRKMIKEFWSSQKRKFENMSDTEFKEYVRHMELPMARVKKIMKIDDDVQQHMISQDAPLFLSCVSELFIQELTLKAWGIVEEGRRKTLQKCDIAAAVAREEHFDFLIDIVPREEARKFALTEGVPSVVTGENTAQSMQYVFTDCETVGSNMFQLDNGQIVHATAIGQPIPISDPSGQIELGSLPQGIQVIQMPGGHL